MDKDSKFTRDEEGYMAVRVVSGTEALPAIDKDYMFARDTNGNIAVRVVGAGGGDPHNLGWYATQSALETAHPTAEDGDWAIVGATDTVWVWDSDTNAWKDTDQKGQVTSVNGQTGAVSLGINDVAPTQTDKSGYVLGTDGFVAGWVKPEIVQRSVLPQASEEEVGNIYQYVGTTDANYTNGYFYKCVSNGQTPATYSWENIEVQEADALPSQAGQSGKFLTTDGTDASWSNKIDNGTNSMTFYLGTSNAPEIYFSNQNGSAWGSGSFTLIVRLKSASAAGDYQGYTGLVGRSSSSYGSNLKILGGTDSQDKWRSVCTEELWNGGRIIVPSQSGTLALTSDLPSSPSTMPELTVAGWANNTQTVTVTGVTATNTVFVSPAPASASDYASAGITCTAQGTDSLTFTCTTVPTNAITVNVVIMG